MTSLPELLPGTLDLLILKTLSLGSEHGYGVLLRIQQLSSDELRIEQGSLYPALYRLQSQGLIESEWGRSENGRRAKFYRLTRAGERRLGERTDNWQRFSDAVGAVLQAQPGEA